MTDRPILFSAPMVRALLDGRKTQTRRVLKPQPPNGWPLLGIYAPALTAVFAAGALGDHTVRLPSIGDRLWVREAMLFSPRDDRLRLLYKADGAEIDLSGMPVEYTVAARDMPGIFMPRWASRLTLTVTDVRVQRLHEITEIEARAEGCREQFEPEHPETPYCSAVGHFAGVWDSLNARRTPWASNPWVVALTFTVARHNIDLPGLSVSADALLPAGADRPPAFPREVTR